MLIIRERERGLGVGRGKKEGKDRIECGFVFVVLGIYECVRLCIRCVYVCVCVCVKVSGMYLCVWCV